MPTGRHRKPTPHRGRWAALAAASVVGLAAALPAAALLRPGDPPESTEATRATDSVRGDDSTVQRLAARTTSRSADRLETHDVLAARWTAAKRGGDQQPVARQMLKVRWLTADLNLWSRPREGGRLLTVLDAGTKVRSTSEVRRGWVQVHKGDGSGWVRRTYLVDKKPKPAAVRTFGTSGTPCPDGSSVEAGLMPNTVKVYRAVCAAFPSVTSWGGRSGSGDHGAGLALDIMVTGSTGYAIADYVRAHAGTLGASEVIWSQRMWSVLRSGDGWRPMSDRGSPTANHYDHVHVSVYG